MTIIRTYIGSARPASERDISPASRAEYRFLLFLQREIMGEHDRARAHREIEKRGWVKIHIERGGRVIHHHKLHNEPDRVKVAYYDALHSGSSLIISKVERLHDV